MTEYFVDVHSGSFLEARTNTIMSSLGTHGKATMWDKKYNKQPSEKDT